MRAPIRTLLGAVVLGVALGVTLLVTPPVSAYPDSPGTVAVDGTCEGELRRLHDQARANAGRAALREDRAFDQVARTWAFNLARTRTLGHNPQHQAQIAQRVPDWSRISENVAMAASAAQIHANWMASTLHRGNILDAAVQRIGVACVRDARGGLWATVNFVGARSAISDRRPTPFRSAGDASSRLRWWLLAQGPSATQVEADATNLLTTWSAADLAVYLAGSTVHEGLVPGTVRLYGGAFDREPDAAGLVYWVQRRQQGTTLEKMATTFAASAEFQELYGNLNNRDFVEQVYRNVLDREPDDSGTDYWVDQLNRGVSRGKVLLGFTESAENKTATRVDVTVSWAFAQLIARKPTAAERSRWVILLDAGGTAEDLVRWLVATDAFGRRVAAGHF